MDGALLPARRHGEPVQQGCPLGAARRYPHSSRLTNKMMTRTRRHEEKKRDGRSKADGGRDRRGRGRTHTGSRSSKDSSTNAGDGRAPAPKGVHERGNQAASQEDPATPPLGSGPRSHLPPVPSPRETVELPVLDQWFPPPAFPEPENWVDVVNVVWSPLLRRHMRALATPGDGSCALWAVLLAGAHGAYTDLEPTRPAATDVLDLRTKVFHAKRQFLLAPHGSHGDLLREACADALAGCRAVDTARLRAIAEKATELGTVSRSWTALPRLCTRGAWTAWLEEVAQGIVAHPVGPPGHGAHRSSPLRPSPQLIALAAAYYDLSATSSDWLSEGDFPWLAAVMGHPILVLRMVHSSAGGTTGEPRWCLGSHRPITLPGWVPAEAAPLVIAHVPMGGGFVANGTQADPADHFIAVGRTAPASTPVAPDTATGIDLGHTPDPRDPHPVALARLLAQIPGPRERHLAGPPTSLQGTSWADLAEEGEECIRIQWTL